MQHVELFDFEHFEKNYYRVQPDAVLNPYIDFFWQTKFDKLWPQYPKGFSDALFPNIGYTYLINLGTPFVMQVGDQKFKMKADGFLPRHNSIECFHQEGNILFGIKFKISPVIFQKKINFSEYKSSIFPLSYLLEKDIIQALKQTESFTQRVAILNAYFATLLHGYSKPIEIVATVIENCINNGYKLSISDEAEKHGISSRTLQRYFEITTSLSSKKTLQILKIRKATEQLVKNPREFKYSDYGYYDYSHFYKHLKAFLKKDLLQRMQAANKKLLYDTTSPVK